YEIAHVAMHGKEEWEEGVYSSPLLRRISAIASLYFISLPLVSTVPVLPGLRHGREHHCSCEVAFRAAQPYQRSEQAYMQHRFRTALPALSVSSEESFHFFTLFLCQF
ncbi:hypothetical protein, partial [Bilophila sp.]|uniref:hypothetical protein n=1 Tax=Bilophila sp. TaxID=1929485 RepID=UPI0030787D65